MARSDRSTGTVKIWHTDRGFGFLARPGASDVFLHAKAFPRDTGEPRVGDTVTFQLEQQADGKFRAANARIVGIEYHVPPKPTSPILAFTAILAFIAIYLLVFLFWGPVPLWVLFLYLGASIIAVVSYAIDKSAARLKQRRVAETTLIMLGMVGGWPGAIVAQQLLRHKTVKSSFRAVFWASVLVNVFVFVALNARPVYALLGLTPPD